MLVRKAAIAGVVGLVLGAAAPAKAVELISNGDFEAGLAGWSTSGAVGTGTPDGYVACCGLAGSPADLANNMVFFGSGNVGLTNTLSQTFATVVGGAYTLTFDASAFGAPSAGNTLIFSVGGISDSISLGTSVSAALPGGFGFAFVGSGSDTLTFLVNSNTFDNADAVIDNVSVQGPAPTAAVPEPGAWALMILGFGLAGGLLRGRRGAVAAPC